MQNRRNYLILNGLIVLLAAGSLAMGGETLERTFSFRGGVLEVDTDTGHINIKTTASGEVRVRIEVSRGDLDEYLDISFDESNGLRIIGREPRNSRDNGGVEFHIEVPRTADVRIKSGGGHIEVGDLDGELVIDTGGGHVKFGDIAGIVQIETGGGHIEGGNIEADARVETGGGHVELGDVRGFAEIETGGGHISVKDVDGELQAETGGGHIRAGHVRADMSLRSGGGHLEAAGCDGDVTAKTGGGEITLEEMNGYVKAHTGGGDVLVALTSSSSGADIESNDDGDITIELPRGAGFDIDAVAAGSVEADVDFRGNRSSDTLSGSIDGGGAEIRVRADDGDIRIVTR